MTRRWMAVALLPGVLALAGCGGDSAATSSGAVAGVSQGTTGDVQDGSGRAGQGPDGFGDAGGGVFGLIAAVDGTTMQVQSDVQTAVTWTDTTTVGREVTADVSAVTVGSCVVALVDDATADTPTATSIAVSDPVDGECTAAAGRFAGGMPTDLPSGDASGRPGGMPSGAPTDMPDGMPTDLPSRGAMPSDGATGMPGGGFGGAIVAGTVTAVDGESATVAQDDGSTTVTVGADATVTATQPADATAIQTGLCVSARGDTDDRGGMTATSLTLSDAVDGACARTGRG